MMHASRSPQADFTPSASEGVRVHSIETGSTTDGPGIRSVIFLQGCALRCRYCHNPDTWDCHGGTLMTTTEILALLEKNRPYYERSGGGVTFSGGEPMLQSPALAPVVKACKEAGFHVTIDCSGFTPQPEGVAEILDAVDLVMLDVKASNPLLYKRLTGVEMAPIQHFLERCIALQKRLWIRHVLVPEWTLKSEALQELAAFLAPYWHGIEKLDFLPYHELGVYKWETLGYLYPLKEIRAATVEDKAWASEIFYQALEANLQSQQGFPARQ